MRSGSAGQHPEGVEAGKQQHVHDRNPLEVKGVSHGCRDVDQQPEGERCG